MLNRSPRRNGIGLTRLSNTWPSWKDTADHYKRQLEDAKVDIAELKKDCTRQEELTWYVIEKLRLSDVYIDGLETKIEDMNAKRG